MSVLDEARTILENRLEELAPAYEEYLMVARALQAMTVRSGPPNKHRERVVEALEHSPDLTTGEIAQATGISRNSLYSVLDHLLRDGRVIKSAELPPPSGQRGRPSVRYRVASNGSAAS